MKKEEVPVEQQATVEAITAEYNKIRGNLDLFEVSPLKIELLVGMGWRASFTVKARQYKPGSYID